MRKNIVRTVGGSVLALGVGLLMTACGPGGAAAGSAPATTTATTATTAFTSAVASSTDSQASSTTTRSASGGGGATTAVYVNLNAESNTPEQHPQELDFYEHTAMENISWSSWGGSTASGTGTLSDDDCTPDCATGHQITYSAHVVLSGVKTVNGQQRYTKYTVTFTGQDKNPELAKALTDQAIQPNYGQN